MKMPKIKSWGLLALIISPIIVTFAGWKLAKAQLTPELLISLEFPSAERPPNDPRSADSGGSRGGCIQKEEIKLTALMPLTQDGDGKSLPLVVGTTTSTNPKFFLYVPENQAELAEFVIQEKSGESNKDIYQTQFKISGYSGIVKLTLPNNVNLQANKEYTWSFHMVCDTQDRASDAYVTGTIKKVEISSYLENKLKNATTPLEKAKIYAEDKIWYDTIATVADLRASNPAVWEELLRSVELKDFVVSAPFAPCCQVEQ